MATYRGLNLRFLLNDIDDRDAALINLGLNREDLERISGLSASLAGGDSTPRQDMRALSGLDIDQEKELYALRISGESVQNNVITIPDVGQTLDLDIIQNGARLVSGAIKYNYLNVADRTPFEIKQADISTSRVSSWSSSAPAPVTDTDPIFYGGDVEITGSNIVYDGQLKVLEAPETIKYEAEVPTHTVTININGTPQKFLAMKGIPLQFESFYRNADFYLEVDYIQNAQGNNIRPVWRVVNEDGSGREYENTNPPLGMSTPTGGSDNPWRFRDVQNRPRTVELYYNPDNITKLRLRSLNLQEWPSIPLANLRSLDIMFNDFYELPNFKVNVPNLEHLYVQGNNMSRGGTVANTQINNNLPTSLTHLNMDGTFSDSTDIDLTNFNNLIDLSFHSYYRSRSSRRMTGGTYTPDVWSTGSGASRNTVIQDYRVNYQPYSRLPDSINESNSIRFLQISALDVTGVGASNNYITLPNATELNYFYSYSNNHNFVDMSNKENLTTYYHVWSGLRNDITGGNTIDGKISGCTKLQVFVPVGVPLRVQNEANPIRAFQTLPVLRYVDLRWTQMAGHFDNQSFTGTSGLRNLYIRHGRWNASGDVNYKLFDESAGQVFGPNTPAFYYLIVQYNKNIRGHIPDFTGNNSLRVCQIQGTRMSGSIPNFNNNRNLGYLYLQDNEFTGNAPSLSGPQFLYVYLNDNLLNGQLEELNCPGLYRYYAYNNSLSGAVPSFANCTRLQYLKLQNNSLKGCSKGTFRSNTQIRQIDLANNALSTDDALNIIDDLVKNYDSRPRGGVNINLQGNLIDTNAINQNPKVVEQLATLRSAGWVISL